MTELGSLAAVGDLCIPDHSNMSIVGGDIGDCFYACQLPQQLLSYSCF